MSKINLIVDELPGQPPRFTFVDDDWIREDRNADRAAERIIKEITNGNDRILPDISLVRTFAGVGGRQGDKDGGK